MLKSKSGHSSREAILFLLVASLCILLSNNHLLGKAIGQQGMEVRSNWSWNAVTIDGKNTTDYEWSDATSFWVDMPVTEETINQTTTPLEVWVKNDAHNLYFLIVFWASPHEDTPRIGIFLDEGHDRSLTDLDEDGKLVYASQQVEDLHRGDQDWVPDDQTNIQAAVTFEAELLEMGKYTFELSFPLDSKDPLDVAIAPGDTIGFAIFYNKGGSPDSHGWWPAEDPSSWGDLIISYPPGVIYCSIAKTPITLGQRVEVIGLIRPIHQHVTVKLNYTRPDNSTFVRSVTTGHDGNFTDTFIPDQSGAWTVKASWEGDSDNCGSDSIMKSFEVTNGWILEDLESPFSLPNYPISNAKDFIHCMAYFSRRNKIPIIVRLSLIGNGLVDVFDAENGRFLLEKTNVTGSESFNIHWDGRGLFEPRVYKGSEISDIILEWSLTEGSSIEISVSPTTVAIGEIMRVKGFILPPHPGAIVTLNYTRPDESVFSETVFTDEYGAFLNTHQPNQVGTWSITASWDGDVGDVGVSSQPKFFTVMEREEATEIADLWPTPINVSTVTVMVLGVIIFIVYLWRKWSYPDS